MPKLSKLLAGVALCTSLANPAFAACLNLFQHFPVGPFSGGSVVLDANTEIHMSPEKFWGPPAAPTTRFGGVEMMALARCFGGPEVLNLNNANLYIKISQRNEDAKTVNVNYCDFGGYENAALNSNTPPSFIGEIDTVPPTLPNAAGNPEDTTVRENPIQGGVEGKFIVEAQSDYIREIVIGGQEFFVHSICVN